MCDAAYLPQQMLGTIRHSISCELFLHVCHCLSSHWYWSKYGDYHQTLGLTYTWFITHPSHASVYSTPCIHRRDSGGVCCWYIFSHASVCFCQHALNGNITSIYDRCRHLVVCACARRRFSKAKTNFKLSGDSQESHMVVVTLQLPVWDNTPVAATTVYAGDHVPWRYRHYRLQGILHCPSPNALFLTVSWWVWRAADKTSPNKLFAITW